MWSTLLATLLTATVVVQADIVKLPESDMTLWGEPDIYKDLVARLDDALPNVRVSDVADDTNHKTNLYPLDPEWWNGFTWAKRPGYNDQDTYRWVPQGITTSSDSYQNGTYEGRNIMLVSWYDNTTEESTDSRNKGVRISFIDATSSNMNLWTYRNVLLVVPEETDTGTISYYPVRIHAGGIMWYGNLLYVVDTTNGIRIFDLDHIHRVSIGGSIGGVRGRFSAALYKYIIPQMGYYRLNSTAITDFRFSFISLDRTSKPDSFIVGEYDPTGNQNRIARFELDYRTRLPVWDIRKNTVVATQLYNIGLKSMQGALSVTEEYEGAKPTYYFTCSKGDGPDAQGDLWTWTVGEGVGVQRGVLSRGPEDMTYDQQNSEIWTLGELSGERPVYSFSTGSIPPP